MSTPPTMDFTFIVINNGEGPFTHALRAPARETITRCISMVVFTHTLHCALLSGAGRNASCVLLAQRSVQCMCERALITTL